MDDPDLHESRRPTAVAGIELTPFQRGHGEHLRDVHDHYRAELDVLVALADRARDGDAELGELRAMVHGMSLRVNIEQLGAICARYCELVTNHHTLEDRAIFPTVKAAGGAYASVVEQLEHEHLAIHARLRRVDAAIIAHDDDGAALPALLDEIDALAAMLRSHFAYEETELTEPLGLLASGDL